MMHLLWLAAGGGGQVQQSNVEASSENVAALASATVTFAADGTTSSSGNQTSSHPIPGEWWSAEPDAGIGAQYEVRCESISSGSFSLEAAAVGTWIDMSSGRNWNRTRAAAAGPGTNSVIATFQIRPTGGSVAATFTVELTATVL